MQPYQVRRAAVILLGIILIVFVIVQSIKWLGNISQNEPSENNLIASSDSTLVEYADNDGRAVLTYSGPIVAKEQYKQVRMTITASERRLEIISGYGEKVSRTVRLDNDLSAYTALLRALYLNGFTNSQDGQVEDDATGTCFRGKRIIGEIFDDNQNVIKLWNTTCGRKLGTMDARFQDILSLFQKQFPDYKDITRNIGF